MISDEKDLNMINSPKIEFDKIIKALDDRDKERLKGLFSNKSLSRTMDIDVQIDKLFEFYQGKFVSNSSFDCGSSTGEKKMGNRFI